MILNKKAIANQESQLFKAELEKFRPHQNRILQANHKQGSLLKELTRTYSDLLKDPRVRSEQSKYDAFSRQRHSVVNKYKKVYQSFNDLNTGISRAQGFYSEMKDTVSSLQKNVETFVNNRRSEGGQLLQNIEQKKSQGADQEQQRLKDLMERMSMEPTGSPVSAGGRKKSVSGVSSPPLGHQQHAYQNSSAYHPVSSPPITPRYQQQTQPQQQYMPQQQQQHHQQQPSYSSNGYQSQQPQYPQQHQHARSHSQSQSAYNPTNYPPVSPPAHQQYFSPPPTQHQQHQPWGQPPQQHQQHGGYQGNTPQPAAGLPQGYVPPPPPPGPPPAQHQEYAGQYGGYQGGYAQGQQQQGQRQSGQQDPWAGLSGWK